MEHWNKLPLWARWILCWPLIFGGSVLAGALFGSILDESQWFGIGGILKPSISALAGLIVMGYMSLLFMPKRPELFMGAVLMLHILVGGYTLVSIGFTLVYTGGEAFAFHGMTRDALHSIVGILTAWGVFRYVKQESQA